VRPLPNRDSLPLSVDEPTRRLAQYALENNYRHLAQSRAEEVAERARKRVPPPANILEGRLAADYLAKLISTLTGDVLDSHRAYGSIRWLWYLRRVPDDLFQGAYTTTLGYDSALAESLSWFLPGEDASMDSKLIAFPINASVFRHVCRFVGGAKLLAHLHAMYRRAGKGAAIDTSTPIPFAQQDHSLNEAIGIYDVRHDRTNEFARTGLGLTGEIPDAAIWEEETKSAASLLFLSI